MEALPALDGYALPADWAPTSRVWMAWPSRIEPWGEDYLLACHALTSLARRVAEFQPVSMLVPPARVAAATLQLARRVEVQAQPVLDCALRDFGPFFVVNDDEALAAVSYHFNGWGNRYHDWTDNLACAEWIADEVAGSSYECPLTLEGSAISADGVGTLLASSDVLLNANRNPTLDRRQVEERLALYFGARKVVWLDGVAQDRLSGGQVADVARFVGPACVVCATLPGQAAGDVLARNLDVLRSTTDGLGRPLNVVELPCAEDADLDGHGIATYVPFGLVDSAVLMPAYGVKADGTAAGILAELFPDREIVPIDMTLLGQHISGPNSLIVPQPDGSR